MSGQAKSIFITGGASGLGREVARFFGQKGWFVGIADVQDAEAHITASMIPEGMSSVHHLDVTNRDQWKIALKEFDKASGGRMDVLFNNAGIGSGGQIEQHDYADIDRMVAVNFIGVINGVKESFEFLAKTPNSCILNTSSASGIYGVADLSVYSATKFAVRGLTESHDIELRRHGIRCRSLMPGFIDTNILSNVPDDSNMTGKEILQSAGVEVSPVTIIGQAAWDAIHGDKVHTYVNKTAKQLAFAARWMPGRLRKQMGGLLRNVVKSDS
ncbi:short-chain dehydrogenase [Sphingorhabdus lutea]|uniref:Short-chain dehydrogenase n=1 Tax=Sphingorhabdus lutea TaxID=1913578 RepID=A0A1L3JD71_9SPHN|nr:SDR family oxidoreductase [Sphingorhabdus lutea]APG63091.1 short-chain dehydrogenase [Sphingorhabdus lutea]